MRVYLPKILSTLRQFENRPGSTDVAAVVQPVSGPTKDDNGAGTEHSEDFTSVLWSGERYSFSKGQQADAVRELWLAWEQHTPTLSEKTIGELIGSSDDNFQLAKIFRRRKKTGGYDRHPAWGTMIQRAHKGVYQLVPPQADDKDQES